MKNDREIFPSVGDERPRGEAAISEEVCGIGLTEKLQEEVATVVML